MIDEQNVPEVLPEVAFKASESGNGVILDVRESDELQQFAIANAIHIPLGELHLRSNEVPGDRDVYVLCHAGQRSAVATMWLMQSGRSNVWNIEGGIIRWIRSGLPAR
jgi:rhodanese-related sulfurtransferase